MKKSQMVSKIRRKRRHNDTTTTIEAQEKTHPIPISKLKSFNTPTKEVITVFESKDFNVNE
jgi:hypothetical protein